jgi:Phage terminase large subunit (GpA)
MVGALVPLREELTAGVPMEGGPREAEYACAHCGALIGEGHKTWMLEHGEWRPTADGDGSTAGFHLSSLYSPAGCPAGRMPRKCTSRRRRPPTL